jgi:hypothetical protein
VKEGLKLRCLGTAFTTGLLMLVDEGCAGWGWYGELIGEGLWGGGRVALQGACGGRGLFSYISFVRVFVCVYMLGTYSP